jgi:integrase
VLERYLEERGELPPDAPLIARQDGKALSVRAIQALFENWRRELGWTRSLHPHVLRHTHATQALAVRVLSLTLFPRASPVLRRDGGMPISHGAWSGGET